MASVLNRVELSKGFAELADPLQQAIASSDLPRSAKENFLNNLSSWPLILESVARNQTRLPRGKGPRLEED